MFPCESGVYALFKSAPSGAVSAIEFSIPRFARTALVSGASFLSAIGRGELRVAPAPRLHLSDTRLELREIDHERHTDHGTGT